MSNKTSDKNVANIEEDVNELKSIMYLRTVSGFAYSQKNTLELQKSIRHILAELEQKDKRIQELEEYISIAPNLDEMTATKYINIQREAYIRGKAEEQQRAEQIIYENYIPKQVVIDLIANETIDISGFECIAVEDLQELLGGEK